MKGYSRRSFVNAGLAVGGGLVLGLTLPRPSGRLQAATLKEPAATQLNAWLRVAADNTITLVVDRSEMGQGVYTALPMLLAEELHVSLDAVKLVFAPVGDAYVSPGNGGQMTGTSNSIQESWDKLRTAGAQARTMLIAVAARRWHITPADCRAENGEVLSAKGRYTYGALADAAAREPLPRDVALKDTKDFTVVGQPRLRLDTAAKVDGSAQFGIDVILPRMLHACIAMSPTLGGKARSVDAGAAQAMPGVRAVIPTDSGVVVVAEHVWQALKARKALKIDWDPGDNHALDTATCERLLRDTEAQGLGLSKTNESRAAERLMQSKDAVRAVYELPLQCHAPMEPMNCTADVHAGGCDLYVGTQSQQLAQAAAAAAAGLKPEQVNVITTLLGGSFGRRLDVDFIPPAVQASQQLGVPVKLIWTREDDMMHDTYKPPAREQMAALIHPSGKRLDAVLLHITGPSIGERVAPPVKGVDDNVIEYAVNFPYANNGYSLSYSRQEIGIDVGFMRSVSHVPNCFAIESFVDELAVSAKRDPLELRIALLEATPRHVRVLTRVAERAGWGKAPAGRHLGVAFMVGYTTSIAQVIEISVTGSTLKVHKVTCVVDCGRMVNPRIVESQIESGIVFGLTSTLFGEITLARGEVQQKNFNGYRMLRLNEMPLIDIELLASDELPGGIGEPGVPPVSPALCNALYAATGRRIRKLPLLKEAGLSL